MLNPKYIEIAEHFKKEISKGKLIPGGVIASEYSLCDQFQTSRMTVRKGLALLIGEGYIHSVPGKGYYVSKPSTDKYLLNFNEVSNIQKSAEKTKLIDVNIVFPDKNIARKLNINTTRRIIIIRRFLIEKGKKIAYDEKYIPYQKGIPIIEKEISYATFPEIVAKKKSIFAIKKELSIKAGISDDFLSRELDMGINKPLMIIEQKLFDEDFVPIGFGITKFSGEGFYLNAVSII